MTKLAKIPKQVNETLLPSSVQIIHVYRQSLVFNSPGLSMVPVPGVDEGNAGI